MSITTAQQAGALPATTQIMTSAKPAYGEHGIPHPADAMPAPMPPTPMPPMPYYNPFDQIANLLEQLRMAIEQLRYPQPDILPPDPYQKGCPHDHGFPIPPVPEPVPAPRRTPVKGDAVGSVYSKKSGRVAITVSSVHSKHSTREAAVKEAKRLAGGKGDALFGVVYSMADDKFTVVGLKSSSPISAQNMGAVATRTFRGLMLDAIAFDRTTARRVTAVEATPATPPTTPTERSDPSPSPPAPPAPETVPAPDEHAH